LPNIFLNLVPIWFWQHISCLKRYIMESSKFVCRFNKLEVVLNFSAHPPNSYTSIVFKSRRQYNVECRYLWLKAGKIKLYISLGGGEGHVHLLAPHNRRPRISLIILHHDDIIELGACRPIQIYNTCYVLRTIVRLIDSTYHRYY